MEVRGLEARGAMKNPRVPVAGPPKYPGAQKNGIRESRHPWALIIHRI